MEIFMAGRRIELFKKGSNGQRKKYLQYKFTFHHDDKCQDFSALKRLFVLRCSY